jgi:hypothetical protein
MATTIGWFPDNYFPQSYWSATYWPNNAPPLDFLWTPTWVIPLVPDVGVSESPDDRYIKDYYQIHSNVEKMFDLVFEGVTDTIRNRISKHYSRVTGPYLPFIWTTVPSYINEGTTMTVRYVDRSYKEDVKSRYWTIEMTFEKDI